MTNGNGGPAQSKPPAAASLAVLGQYIKDFSFENPSAPRSLTQLTKPPQINLQINVNAKPLSDTDYEVELKVEGKADNEGTLLFHVDLVYGGVFRVQNVPTENIHPLVLIECPRLLFPFARQIISDAVSAGGFPPLLLEPVDFAALYRQRAAQAQPQAPQTA